MNKKKILTFFGLGALIISLGMGVDAINKRVGFFEYRKKAAPVEGAIFQFRGPDEVVVGKQFTVDIVLDATDSKYTVSGVDAVVSYIFEPADGSKSDRSQVELVIVRPGEIFDSYPTLERFDREDSVKSAFDIQQELLAQNVANGGCAIVGCNGEVCIDEEFYNKNPFSTTCVYKQLHGCYQKHGVCERQDNGRCGWTQNSQLKECLSSSNGSLPALQPTIEPVTPRATFAPVVTSTPVPVIVPTRAPSSSNQIIISGIKNYAVNDKGYFEGFNGSGVFATLVFVVNTPGKLNLSFDYRGANGANDTNINGFLASQPVKLQKPQEILFNAPSAFNINVKQASAPPPVPQETLEPATSFTDSTKCIALPKCVNNNPPCSIDIPPGATLCSTPSPATPRQAPTTAPTSKPQAPLFFHLELEGRVNHAINVDLYARVMNSFSPKGTWNKVASVRTDASGYGNTIISNEEFIGKPLQFYVESPSHIRALHRGDYITLNLPLLTVPVVQTVEFGTLIAGDIYTDAQGKKDNVINSFDISSLFSQWTGREEKLLINAAADLNGDRVVNNRDLAMMIRNYRKKGNVETSIKPPSTYVCPGTGYINCAPRTIGGPDLRTQDTASNYSCVPEYIKWAKANCPNFKGIAY